MSSSAASSEVVAAEKPRAEFASKLASALHQQLSMAPSSDPISLSANFSALVYQLYTQTYGPDAVNWCGFYFLRNVLNASAPAQAAAEQKESDSAAAASSSSSSAAAAPTHPRVLILGPFQGLAAVSVIKIGKGVCGTSIQEEKTQIIRNVHEHPNHIACDSRSASELVIPIFADSEKKKIVGVLDMDSPRLGMFSDVDGAGLEPLIARLGLMADWSVLEKPIQVQIPEDDVCPMSHASKKTRHH